MYTVEDSKKGDGEAKFPPKLPVGSTSKLYFRFPLYYRKQSIKQLDF